MEFNNELFKTEHMSESISNPISGIHLNRNELNAKYDNFFEYINKSIMNYCKWVKNDKGKRIIKNDSTDILNQVDNKVFLRFHKKFKNAYKEWKKRLKGNGTVDFYIGRVLDALYIGLWDFDYVNDPNGTLTPFGPYLFQLLEVHRHRRIGILHALEQQQSHPHNKILIGAQLLSNEIFKIFFTYRRAGDYWPIIQFSAGGPAAFFCTPYTPTIITMDKTKSEKIEDFSALPHECGHAIAGTRPGRNLIKTMGDKIKEEFENKTDFNKYIYNDYWKWWIEECFADAIAVAVLGESEIISLAYLFKDSEINAIYRDSRHLRVDEHPNRFIRILVAIAVGERLGIDLEILKKCRDDWEKFAIKSNGKKKLYAIHDKFKSRNVKLDQLRKSIDFVAYILVDTKYENSNKNKRGKSIKNLFDKIKSKSSTETKSRAYEFLSNLKSAIKSNKDEIIKV